LLPSRYPLFNRHWRTIPLKGKLSSPEIALKSKDKAILLQNIDVPFEWDPGTKMISLKLSSQVQNPLEGTGSIQGQLNLTHFLFEKGIDWSQVTLLGSLDLQNLSSALLDAFYKDVSLSVILGPIFSSKLKFQSAQDKQNFSIKWISPNLNIDSAFVMDSTNLQLQGTNNQISWMLTPESYKILDQTITRSKGLSFKSDELREIGLISSKKKKENRSSNPPEPKSPLRPQAPPSPFGINEPSTFLISLSKLSLPLLPQPEVHGLSSRIPKIMFDLSKLQLAVTGRNTKLSFFDKSSKETIQLSNLSFALNKTADKGPLSVSLDSGILTMSGSPSAPESVKMDRFL